MEFVGGVSTLRKHTSNSFPVAKAGKGWMPPEQSPLPATSVFPASARSMFAPQARTGTVVPRLRFVFRWCGEAWLVSIRDREGED